MTQQPTLLASGQVNNMSAATSSNAIATTSLTADTKEKLDAKTSAATPARDLLSNLTAKEDDRIRLERRNIRTISPQNNDPPSPSSAFSSKRRVKIGLPPKRKSSEDDDDGGKEKDRDDDDDDGKTMKSRSAFGSRQQNQNPSKRGRGGGLFGGKRPSMSIEGSESKGGSTMSARATAIAAKITPKAQIERDLLCAQMEAKQHLERVGDRDREIVELKKELAAVRADLAREQAEVKKYYQSVDARTSNLIEAVTHHMGKSHNSAMQTLQQSQLINAGAMGISIERLRHGSEKMKLLMPPLRDVTTNSPMTKEAYTADVSDFLRKKVTDLPAGEALLTKIDKAIEENQLASQEERGKMNKNMPVAEITQLQQTLSELEEHLEALKFERNILVAGLEKYKREQMAIHAKISVLHASATPSAVVPPTPTPTTVSSTTAVKK